MDPKEIKEIFDQAVAERKAIRDRILLALEGDKEAQEYFVALQGELRTFRHLNIELLQVFDVMIPQLPEGFRRQASLRYSKALEAANQDQS